MAALGKDDHRRLFEHERGIIVNVDFLCRQQTETGKRDRLDQTRIVVPDAAEPRLTSAVVAVTQEAIRVCGGRAFLKRYPLERYARDARAAALMRPWTEEIATQQAWEAALGLDRQPRGPDTV